MQIIAARKRGFKPLAIFFDAGFDPTPTRFDFERPEWALAHNLHATVTIPLGELGKRLDLRFVAGCTVIVSGYSWSNELMLFLDNLTACVPNIIAVCCINESQEIMRWENGKWVVYAN